MKKYCRECGQKLLEYNTGKFSEETGKEISALHCENLKCEEGCGNVTRHNNWNCFKNRCRDCGYSIQDY